MAVWRWEGGRERGESGEADGRGGGLATEDLKGGEKSFETFLFLFFLLNFPLFWVGGVCGGRLWGSGEGVGRLGSLSHGGLIGIS